MNQPATAHATSKPLLSLVKRSKAENPIRAAIFGAAGMGKTTFGADAPDPVFMCAENGLAGFDLPMLEPETWQQVLSTLDQLATDEHSFKTLVVDTLTRLEALVNVRVLELHGKGKTNITDIAYGKGGDYAADEWRVFISKLETIWSKRGMNVVLIAHSHTAKIKNPAGGDYGVITIKLDARAEGLIREWSDACLYAEMGSIQVGGDEKRAKIVSDGVRVLRTSPVAGSAFIAKNRYNLPDTLPLNWQAFADAVKANRPAEPEVSKARIAKLLEGAEAEYAAKVRAAVEHNTNDAVMLAKIANKVAAQVAIKESANV